VLAAGLTLALGMLGCGGSRPTAAEPTDSHELAVGSTCSSLPGGSRHFAELEGDFNPANGNYRTVLASLDHDSLPVPSLKTDISGWTMEADMRVETGPTQGSFRLVRADGTSFDYVPGEGGAVSKMGDGSKIVPDGSGYALVTFDKSVKLSFVPQQWLYFDHVATPPLDDPSHPPTPPRCDTLPETSTQSCWDYQGHRQLTTLYMLAKLTLLDGSTTVFHRDPLNGRVRTIEGPWHTNLVTIDWYPSALLLKTMTDPTGYAASFSWTTHDASANPRLKDLTMVQVPGSVSTPVMTTKIGYVPGPNRRIETITAPNNVVTTYSYYYSGLLQSIGEAIGPGIAASYRFAVTGYSSAGATVATFANGVQSRAVTLRLQPETCWYLGSSLGSVYNLDTITPDANGRATIVTDKNGHESARYTYPPGKPLWFMPNVEDSFKNTVTVVGGQFDEFGNAKQVAVSHNGSAPLTLTPTVDEWNRRVGMKSVQGEVKWVLPAPTDRTSQVKMMVNGQEELRVDRVPAGPPGTFKSLTAWQKQRQVGRAIFFDDTTKPYAGMPQVLCAGGRCTKYEYDAFGRLSKLAVANLQEVSVAEYTVTDFAPDNTPHKVETVLPDGVTKRVLTVDSVIRMDWKTVRTLVVKDAGQQIYQLVVIHDQFGDFVGGSETDADGKTRPLDKEENNP
jgi:hypothetical protein